jgi:hypothetical protein
LFIALSDVGGPIGAFKEAVAVGRAITDSASGDAPEIVKDLAATVRSGGGRPVVPEMPQGDRGKIKETLTTVIKTAVGAVQTKSPAEAERYRTWLASVGEKVAKASKEGGFLGVGGTVVSEDEQEGLKQLDEILGLKHATGVRP